MVIRTETYWPDRDAAWAAALERMQPGAVVAVLCLGARRYVVTTARTVRL